MILSQDTDEVKKISSMVDTTIELVIFPFDRERNKIREFYM